MRFLCALLLSAPLLAFADAAEDLKTHLDKMQDLKGQFSQVLADKSGATLQSSQGEFAVKRPGYFLWETAAPYEQTVIGTPEKIWVYDPDLEQVTVRSAVKQKANNPAELLSGDLTEIRANFEVTAKGEDKRAEFHLSPLAEESPYRHITFTFDKGALIGLRFLDKLNQETRITFEKLQLNSNIPADTFVFNAPEGTDVIVDD